MVLAVVQLDELYAKVRDSEKAAWLWLAIDPVPLLHANTIRAACIMITAGLPKGKTVSDALIDPHRPYVSNFLLAKYARSRGK